MAFAISCTKEKIEIVDDTGMILGRWEGFVQATAVYKDGNVDNYYNSLCNGIEMYQFWEDGRLFFVDFVQVAVDGCGENMDTKQYGNWKRLSNCKYRITLFLEPDNSELVIEPYSIEFVEEGRFMDIRFEEFYTGSNDSIAYIFQRFGRKN